MEKTFTSVCQVTGEKENFPMTGGMCYEAMPQGSIIFFEIVKSHVEKVYTARSAFVKNPNLKELEEDFAFFGIKESHQKDIKNHFSL